MVTNEAAAVHLEAVSDETVVQTNTIDALPDSGVSTGDAAEPKNSGTGPPRRSRIRRFFRGLVGLLLIAAVAAGAIVGWPVFNERVLQPVETTAADTAALQDRASANDERITDLDAEVIQLRETLAAMAEEQSTAREEGAVAIERRLEILQALDQLSRARLYLFEANYGSAKADVMSARAAVAELSDRTNGDDAVLVEVISRLDRVIEALPDRPVVASGDLDIAWQLLIEGAPAASTPLPADDAPADDGSAS